MEPTEVERAVAAGTSAAAALGLQVGDVAVLHNSNRIAVRLGLDLLARIAPLDRQAGAQFEVEVAHRLAETGSPVAEPHARAEPRVYVRGGFATTLWTYYEPMPPSEIAPAEYAQALARLHAGLRRIDVSAPHFTDRVASAQSLVADHEQTPELIDADRELLGDALSGLSAAITARGIREQLLHGEPHLGNVLRTRNGLLFIDFETCCRGPVEFDLAHGLLPSAAGQKLQAIDDACAQYSGADPDVVEQCCILIWAMITTWRWQRDDQLPNGRYWAAEGLNQLRTALARQASKEA